MRQRNTDNLLLGTQHTQLAKADVKGGTLERSIRLSHHNDIDPSGESGGVKATAQLLRRPKHRLHKLAHNIHGLGLEPKKQEVRTVRPSFTKKEQKVSAFSIFCCLRFDP